MSNSDTTRVMSAAAPQERTMVVPGGTNATIAMPGTSDSGRTQMGGTVTCPICSSATPLMDPYCGDCGFLLASTRVEEAATPTEESPAAELVDSQTGRRFRLRTGINSLGRQGTDVLVNEGTVSRNHATITVEDGVVSIEDLGSSNGTKVADQRLTPNQPVRAGSGEALRFGNWNVTLEIGRSPARTAAETDTCPPVGSESDMTLVSVAFSSEDTFVATSLVSPAATTQSSESVDPIAGGAFVGLLRRIEGAGDDIAVTEGVITIGRRPENTVVLTDDAYVSGRHAEIVTDPTGTYIKDLGSTNGTIVNGATLTPLESLPLKLGDEVHIGQSKFHFQDGDMEIENDESDDPVPANESTVEPGTA